MLSADVSMVPMHWVFEYPCSRLYTYLSLSLPSGIVYTCNYKYVYASMVKAVHVW